MIILLDTCEFLWFISGDTRLAPSVQAAVQLPANEVYLSVVSVWEICIKHALNKLILPQPPETYVPFQRERHGIDSLNLDETAVTRRPQLPSHHRTPLTVCWLAKPRLMA
jgi:PIN domain nuclease of toxin-antitoxin system